MCQTELSENELAVIGLVLLKHQTLVDMGQLPELIGFTSDDFDCLISKVDKGQKIAWLREQRSREK